MNLPEPSAIEAAMLPEDRLEQVTAAIRDAYALIDRYLEIRTDSIHRLHEQGWTQREIAGVAEVDPAKVNRIIRGKG